MAASTPERTFVARTPHDLVNLVPHALGFEPTNSIVMMTFGPKSFHARVDIPFDAPGRREVAEALVVPVKQHGVERVILLAYTDDERLANAALDHLDLAMPVPVLLALQVGPGWLRLRDSDTRQPIEVTAEGTRANVEMGAPRASRDDYLRMVATNPAPSSRLADRLEDDDTFNGAILGLTRENAETNLDTYLADLRDTAPGRGARLAALVCLAAWLKGNGALAWIAHDRSTADGDTPLTKAMHLALSNAIDPDTWTEFRAALLED